MSYMESEYALKLTRALRDYDLDGLIGLIKPQMAWPPKQLHANLRPIFNAASSDQINLLHPPADFQTWLQTPLRQTVRGPMTAKPNTINARTATLSALYNHLIDEGLLLTHPLRGLERTPVIRTPDPLPSPEEIARLLAEAQADPALFAALTLIYHHGLQVTEILSLQWPAFHYDDGTLLRKKTATRLDQASYAALDRLLAGVGGPLAQPQHRIFPYDTQDALRLRIFQTCRQAGLAFIHPVRLRKAALRDFVLSPDQAGFLSAQAFELAEKLARELESGV